MEDQPEAEGEAAALLNVLDITAPANGPRKGPPVPVHAEYSRELTEADIAALSLPADDRRPARSLVRIHASHHSVAKCLATGMKPAQAGLVTGYSAQSINRLQGDPAFQALVADYRTEAKTAFADLAERMNDMSLDAIEILQERMQASPEGFTIPVLLDIVKAFADRTGHGPGQEVHLKVDRDFIDRPPRESFEQWKERRTQELTAPAKAEDTLN